MNPPEARARGRMITLEGIEGVGKTTSLEIVGQLLRDAGKDVVVTREPGGVPFAEKVRELLLAREQLPPPMSELLMMFAARAAHLLELIEPALDGGRWVLCDRFTDATYAYQGAGRGLSIDSIRILEDLVQGDFRPDLTLLLDADPRVTAARREKRGVSDRFELENAGFFERVRANYLERAQAEPGRFRVVDASAPVDDVRVAITGIVRKYISETSK